MVLMKILVVGGTGTLGSKVVRQLRGAGHDAVAASPSTGVNSLTGEGLAGAMEGATAVIDVSNSPSFADEPVMEFFRTSTKNLLEAEARAGVAHHVLLSIVGADRMPGSGYLRAKVAQEAQVKASGRAYTILRATQFFEFVPGIADGSATGDTVRLSPAHLQPVAAEDVASLLVEIVAEPPRNATVEIGGPERIGLDAVVRQLFAARSDSRQVITDPAAGYFGAVLDDRSLTTSDGARLGKQRFAEWLRSA
jgi:uncharacterized protein YbjT (DUF2867 family)